MLRGLAGICYSTDDLPAAIAWYAEIVGTEPYFVRPVDGPPAYAEFRVGDLQAELGLIDRRYVPAEAARAWAAPSPLGMWTTFGARSTG